MKGVRVITPASASTIDVFDVDNTPSLVGYWKCNGTGTTIRDYSQYGHDLAIQLSSQDTMAGVWENSGYFSPRFATRAIITATGTPLDTQNKVVVASCEIKRLTSLDDLDAGTATDYVNTWSAETYTGFMLGGANGNYYSRVVNGVGYQGSSVSISVGSTVNMAMGFVPSGRLVQSDSIAKILETVAAPLVATLIAQDGKFGFQGPAGRVALRNYQVWAFDTEPSNLNTTVLWMAASPGLVPPWWSGL